jgi:hypothetical protein
MASVIGDANGRQRRRGACETCSVGLFAVVWCALGVWIAVVSALLVLERDPRGVLIAAGGALGAAAAFRGNSPYRLVWTTLVLAATAVGLLVPVAAYGY